MGFRCQQVLHGRIDEMKGELQLEPNRKTLLTGSHIMYENADAETRC